MRKLLPLFGLCLLMEICQPAQAAELFPPVTNSGPRARVVTVCDPEATDTFQARPGVIRTMVDRGIMSLTERTTIAAAWRSLISTQDIVGLKVFCLPGPHSGTRPAVVAAVIEGLLTAGLPPNQIVIWDKQTTDLRLAGFFDLAERYGARAAGSAQAGYDEKDPYVTALIGNLAWGDFEFGKKGDGVGRRSFISKLVSQELTKIINVTPLLNHNLAGVSGNLYSLATGSVDNIARFESDAGRLANAVPEVYALKQIGDKVVLNITDALLCQYEGAERGLLHYSATLNELRLSRDPVALDVLSLQELDRQRLVANVLAAKPIMDLYNNAALLELGVSDLKRIHIETITLKE